MVSESASASVTFPYERQAMRGEEIPGGIGYPDQILFLSLRMLYAQLRQGVVDRPTAIREKKKLLDEYRCYQYREKMGEEWVEQIKRTEIARAEFNKNPTVENGRKLVQAIDGRNT